MVRLDPAKKAGLLRTLKEGKPSLDLDEIATTFAAQYGVETEAAKRIIWMLQNMYSSRVQMGASANDFAEGLARAANAVDSSSYKAPSHEVASSKDFLRDVLSLDTTLGIVSRGMSILLEQERLFSECRVFSDVRPVFDADLGAAPSAAVIVHKLKIDYQQDDENKSFFVSLDATDLMRLRDVVERAIKKDAGLRHSMASAIGAIL